MNEEILKGDLMIYKERQEKIQNLVDIAFTKGLVEAVAVARAYKDPYILDEFHDLLTKDDAFKALVSQKLLDELKS